MTSGIEGGCRKAARLALSQSSLNNHNLETFSSEQTIIEDGERATPMFLGFERAVAGTGGEVARRAVDVRAAALVWARQDGRNQPTATEMSVLPQFPGGEGGGASIILLQ